MKTKELRKRVELELAIAEGHKSFFEEHPYALVMRHINETRNLSDIELYSELLKKL